MADAIKAAMARLMKENSEKPNKERPPNLRQGDARENCSTCTHFAAGLCKLYQYRVRPDQTCDSWTPIPEK